MIQYINGAPVYWRAETSGKMEEAVHAYWQPYAENSQAPAPELSDEHITVLRMYIVHWAEAPAWKNNPDITEELRSDLIRAIAMAHLMRTRMRSVPLLCNGQMLPASRRDDISKVLNKLLEHGIDPF